MKKMVIGTISISIGVLFFTNGYSEEISKLGDIMLGINISEQVSEPELETFYMCLLKRGPNWTAEESPENIKLQNLHQQNLSELMGSGQLLLAGPFADGDDTRGMGVFKANSLEEAQALMSDDALVKAGHLVLEWYTWLMPVGLLI